MNKTIYTTLVRPLVTEKGTHLSQARNAYSFEVAPEANKAQVKEAVEKMYNVKVLAVRTANRKGKARRVGWRYGKTKHWKKAVVVLHQDFHIDLF